MRNFTNVLWPGAYVKHDPRRKTTWRGLNLEMKVVIPGRCGADLHFSRQNNTVDGTVNYDNCRTAAGWSNTHKAGQLPECTACLARVCEKLISIKPKLKTELEEERLRPKPHVKRPVRRVR